MELLRDEEREEDGLLPDWTAGLDAPVLPREKSGGAGQTERDAGAGAETDGPQSGPEAGTAVRGAETDVWDDPNGMPDPGWMEDELKRPHKPVNNGENGYSDSLNGGIWPDGTVGRRRLDAPDGRDDGAREFEPGAALDGLARALGSSGSVLPEMGRRAGTGRTAGAGRLDRTAPEIPAGWMLADSEGTKAFAELDKAARAEADSGVEWLYRQAARAEWQTVPAAGAVSAARLAETGSGSAAALTVEELDRAVRRDSRRYDGEMSIY